ncbi:MAG: sigma-70 family RNA polymerase sigma factor [Spirochaetaceae bacterium]|jgi:RNA polymerase sigma-70 factor (ECF subfamily)|nr:sigma-70 family RNA polymerase sigma factor [Spirochaetaceae bacterium]
MTHNHSREGASGAYDACDDDAAYVSAVLGGNTALYRVLVQKHERHVYGMGLGFFHNAEDAADFTQDVFLQAFRKLSQFEGKARFSTGLYSVAWRTAVNRKERTREYQSIADSEFESAYDTPEDANIKAVTRQAIREAVAELPEKYRVCIDLYFFYDRSYQEIEVITGFPVNTIKSHVFRAKKILKEKLLNFVEA